MNKRVCRHGLNDIWINPENGNVRICGWTNYFLGNLTENTFNELWNGEKAKIFRDSMLDGSYRFCNPAKCPYCANEKLDEHLTDYKVPEYPEYCSLSYQRECNYVCKFCRKEKITTKCDYDSIEKEIAIIIPHLKRIGMNGAGEFFCSQSIMNLIKESKLDNISDVLIESNGSLFNELNWAKIEKLGEKNLSVDITVHSFNEKTYQYLSGTSLPINNIIQNLYFISSLRNRGIVNKFEIATVVCERNFREMPEYVKFCLDNFSVDTIRLRFFEPYGVMSKTTEWFYDVRNVYHPYHDEFVDVMRDPIFNNPKVWKWQGETDSLQKESYYELEHKNTVDFSKMYRCENLGKLVVLWKKHNNIEQWALYGASYLGRSYSKLFADNGHPISAIFDTYEEEKEDNGVAIKRPRYEELEKYQCIIITNNTVSDRIKEELMRNQYKGKILLMSDFIFELGL